MNKDIKRKYVNNLIAILLTYAVIKGLIVTESINRYFITIIIFILMNIILASSLNLATGFLGQLALGHAGFMAIGAYTAGFAAIQLADSGMEKGPLMFFGCALLAGCMAGAVGILIGIPALRLKGDYLGIITLGFGEVIRVVFNNFKLVGGAQGLTGIPRIATFDNVFILTVIVVTIIYTLMVSRHGRAILSIREDEIAAESVGIRTTKYKVLGFSIAAFFAGVGGSVYAFQMAVLSPKTFGFIKSVELVVIVVLGGMGSLTGSILSAIVLTILPEALRAFDSYRLLIYSFALILMMIFRPQGIFGTTEFSLNNFLAKRKKKGKRGSDNGNA